MTKRAVVKKKQLHLLALFLIFLKNHRSTNGLELASVSKNFTDYKNHSRNLQVNQVQQSSDSLEKSEAQKMTITLQRVMLKVVTRRQKVKRNQQTLKHEAQVLTNSLTG